eukprot:TRINITY_DN5084_c0_g1_i2.p2 TRINITY_DN5084_c0_g1~~TRINITY_DN5084_c0_g1_i2.p2  ORF type:complete len:111 (+),score=31.75 TRINITY_DN5084_c0_g1_i2:56-388(+)
MSGLCFGRGLVLCGVSLFLFFVYYTFFFFLMIRRPPRSTHCISSAASDVYKRQEYMGFGKGINVTLGLPIIRTSVDHGTALELAGTGQADPGSLFESIAEAARMAKRSIQ